MKRKTYIILSIIAVVILIIGTTFALVFFRGEVSNVNLTVSTDIGQYINYVNGNATISGDTLNMGSDYTSGIFTEIEFWKKEEAKGMNLFGHIYLDIDLGSDNLLNSPALKWAIVSNDILLGEGNFVGYNQDDSIPILVNQKLLSLLTKFKIYIWLDETEAINASEGDSFVVTVRCEVTTGEYEMFGGSIFDFDYTGDIQSISLAAGAYLLEVWGAQGGYAYDETYHGGYGGYSKGNIFLYQAKILYVAVGGKGGNGTSKVSTLNAGGFNGGGDTYGATNKYTGSAGGATHIALVSGELSSFVDTLDENLENILIVAGGGGASSYYQETSWNLGGNGGGYIGNDGTQSSTTSVYGQGGTQTSGGAGYISGSFGQGANATAESIGGGGGFYGGGAGRYNSSGGGGSGYIGNPLLYDKVMYCYECQDSTEEIDETDIKTISTNEVNEAATSNQAKIGNGYARITAFNGMPLITILERKAINYGMNYDFKSSIINDLPEDYTVIYSTYDNANTLTTGEYQIRYIAKDTYGNKYNYYQKIDVIGG